MTIIRYSMYIAGIFLGAIGLWFLFSAKHNPVISYKQSEKKNSSDIIVTRILDGDTVVTNDNKHIRYVGINTAEKGEAYSHEAAQLNEQLVLGKPVHLEFDKQEKDRYNRVLAYVFVEDIFVNEKIIQQGLAITDFMQKNMLYEERLQNAQTYAKEHCLGMWEGLCEQSTSHQCIKIASIQYDAPGIDDKNKNEEWIVIENICDKSISIDKWLLKDTSSSN